MNLENILAGMEEAAQEAAHFIRKERVNFSRDMAEKKGLNDLVSYVDKQSEKMIVERLARLIPDAGFIVEENSRTNRGTYNWIVDPLDGTTNFIHGIPCYAVSIALEKENDILAGVVIEVNRSECFSAVKGGGAKLNDTKISVSETTSLSDSLIATGFPIYNFSYQEKYLNVLRELMHTTHGIRRIGAAAADLCYLACGRFDAFFEYNLSPWDVAAAALIIKEAGGSVTDFSGAQNWLFGKQIIATNKHIEQDFYSLVNKHFAD